MTDNDIKYKAIFGDMAQFNGMMPDCEFVDGTYGYKRVGKAFYYCERHNEKYGWSLSKKLRIDFRPIAMRHIIKAPVWTKADQEKGILPTVGCLCIEGMYPEEVIAVTSKYIVTKTKTDGVCTTSIETFKRTYRPIETPREKYDRERDECIDKLLAKIPTSPITVVPAMKIMYEELRPFTGDNHD